MPAVLAVAVATLWIAPALARTIAAPQGSGLILSAVSWLQGTMMGRVAMVVAVIAVAMVGFGMLTGRINSQNVAVVILRLLQPVRCGQHRRRHPQRGGGRLTEERRALQAAVDALVAALGAYEPSFRSPYDTPDGARSEPLEFLSWLLNELGPVTLPNGYLGQYIPARRISFGQNTFDLAPAGRSPRRFGALVVIRD